MHGTVYQCIPLPVDTGPSLEYRTWCRTPEHEIKHNYRCGAQHSARAALLRISIANISGTERDIDNRKTALQTTIAPASANIIS